MRIFGRAIVALSLVVALLSAAPFTPAVLLAPILLSAAAVLAWQGESGAGFLTLAFCVLTFVFSPLRVAELLEWPVVVVWVSFTSLAVITGLVSTVRSRRKRHTT
jgi:hypothetical protein